MILGLIGNRIFFSKIQLKPYDCMFLSNDRVMKLEKQQLLKFRIQVNTVLDKKSNK